jgi:hypothetical protein
MFAKMILHGLAATALVAAFALVYAAQAQPSAPLHWEGR